MNSVYIISLVFLFSTGTDKIENSLISNPQSISIDLKGNIYLADTGNNRILKFDPDGGFIKSVGGFGWGKEQFDTPVDICATNVLDIFIADYQNQRVERYDKDLNYISSLSSDQSISESLQFGYPCGVSISIHGELVIIDSENRRMLKINSFGKPTMSFGGVTEGKGKLDAPYQVEISRDDKIYVSDRASHRVVVFDYFGNYLIEIGQGVLNRPMGICYDRQNRLWVADNGNKQICVFDPQGEILLKWQHVQSTNSQFKNPLDVAITDDKAYILDDKLIHVFQILRNVTKQESKN